MTNNLEIDIITDKPNILNLSNTSKLHITIEDIEYIIVSDNYIDLEIK